MGKKKQGSAAHLFWLGIALLAYIAVNAMPAAALGIMPAKLDKDITQGETFTGKFTIVNNEFHDMRVSIQVRGELRKYIALETDSLEFTVGEEQKSISYTVSLPDGEMKPGLHTAEIVVLETPASLQLQKDDVVIATSSAMVYRLNLRTPFPGKYLESKMVISHQKESHEVRFALPVFNLGKEQLQKVKANIKVYSPQNEIVTELNTNEVALEPRAQSELVAVWSDYANLGIYRAISTIDYDGKTIVLEVDFTLGKKLIEVFRIDVPEFTIGTIAIFDIFLQNQWNEFIEDVYGEMMVTDQQGKLLSQFKTASIDMRPLGMDKIVAYWDTRGISIGDYNLQLLIHYDGETTEKLVKATVNLDSITTDLAPTGRAIGSKTSETRDLALTLLVIVLLIVNVAWFWYFIKSRKKAKAVAEYKKPGQADTAPDGEIRQDKNIGKVK